MAEPETSIMRELTDNQGTVQMRIFSTTGVPQTKAAFEKALAFAQKNNGVAPSGFTILEPGVASTLRQGFEAVNQPIQQAAGALDDPQARINMLPAPVAGLLKGALRLPAEQVATPARAGVTLGTAAAAPFLGPVSGVAASGAVSALPRALPLVGNMLKAAALGAGGGATAKLLTGEPVTPGATAIDAGIAALSGGFQGVVNHFLTKYLTPNRAEEAARGMLGEIARQYPHLRSDPNLLQMVGSGKEGLQAVTQWGMQGLRGSIDDVAGAMTNDIAELVNLHAPRSLSIGQQNTLRAMGRQLAKYGNDALDNINKPGAFAEADTALATQATKIVQYIEDQVGKMGMKDKVVLLAQVDQALRPQTVGLQQFRQGAKVLAALRESGAESGFDPVRFNNIVAGRYREEPGSLLEKVGKQLGLGTPLTKGADIPAPAQEAANTLLGVVRDRLPLPLRMLLGGKASTPNVTLPWQLPGGTLTPAGNIPLLLAPSAAIRSGNDAIRSFTGE